MSSERASDVSQTHPPDDGAPWDHLGEPVDPAGEPVDPGAWDPVDPPADDTPPSSMYEVGTSDAEPAPAEPERRRWNFLPRSLSSRLVLFVVALVIVVVTAAGTATYLSLKSFLYDRLDQQLTTTATPGRVDLLLSNRVPPDSFGGPQLVWIAVLAVDGSMTAEQPQGPDIRTLTLSDGARSSLVDGVTSPRTLTGTNGVRVRAVSLASDFENRQGEPVTVVVGLSTSEVDRTLHRLVLIEIAIGAAAVAVALLLTSWGVRLSLRPLNRVTRTAREVTAELSPEGAGLDRRVPVTDPETEVGQLGDSFNTLMGTVETQFAARVESEERMRQFLADASHELRTPLTSIRGYAELSRMKRANGEAEQSDTLDRIESEGLRMSRLVDDLLLLARSDQGAPPQWESVDVGELVEDAVEGARAAFPQRRIDADAPAALTVLADHDQLLRVLRNLIANAALHTAPGGPIHVSGRLEGYDVVLRVADSGPGLPPEEAQHVFERFWRADKARTRARGGSGLGLAIVASIVQAHGGTVDFESSVESGSTVTVRLPVNPEAEGAAG